MPNILNQSNLQEAESLGSNGDSSFNCWGGTLFVLDKSEILDWVCCEDMAEFLDENTFIVENRKSGDILALYCYDRLVHTAVFIDENTLWHKKGCNRSEYASEEEVKECYKHDDFEILRIN